MSRPFLQSGHVGLRSLGVIILLALLLFPMACHPKTDIAIPELVLKVSDDGTLTLDNENVTLESLKQKLAEAWSRNHQIKLAVRAEGTVRWTTMSKVFDAARDAHIDVASTVSMAAPPSDWSGKQFRPSVPQPMLNPAEVDALEARLAADPEDFSARRDLINYYGFRDRGAKDKLVLWIIEHHPEFSARGPDMALNPIMEESAYKEGKALWLRHVKDQPTNTVILGNAAAYFLLPDRALAEELLKRAEVLEPRNPTWPERLGQLYKLEAQNKSASLAARALAEFEKTRVLTAPTVPGSPGLADLGKMALVAGDLEKARTYATELLGPGMQWSGGGNAETAFFQGNILLGRIALREGKIDEAKKFLLEAGTTKGSPVLDSFGPDMSLAKELLEKHETNAVLDYFQECEKFWPKYGNEDKLAEWTSAVKNGKIPNFGANLVY